MIYIMCLDFIEGNISVVDYKVKKKKQVKWNWNSKIAKNNEIKKQVK